MPEPTVKQGLRLLAGAATLTVMGCSTVVLTVTLCVLALGKALAPEGPARQWVRSRLARIAEMWISVNNAVLALHRQPVWNVALPGGLDPGGCYLVISNHQSWVDILVLQRCFSRRLPLLRFFLKRGLFWVPFLGLAWWALDFPFMRRLSGERRRSRSAGGSADLEAARRACEKFTRVPVAMMNFLEGTRSTPLKRQNTRSPYRHLLQPRIGGIGQVLYALGNRLDGCVDVTIVYPGSPGNVPPTFWQLISGQLPQVVVRARQRTIPPDLRGRSFRGDPALRRELEAWVTSIWQEKDDEIENVLRNPRRFHSDI